MKRKILATILFFVIIALAVIFSLTGCGSLDFLKERVPEREKSTEWSKDVRIHVNGQNFLGMGLVEKSDLYEIKVYPNGDKIDRIIWSSCTTQRYCDRNGECDLGKFKPEKWPPWSPNDKYFKFMYRRSKLEMENQCPLRIYALEGKKKNHGFGMIIFPMEREEVSIRATLECNGYTERFENGQSFCQARQNLLQRITFDMRTYFDENIKSYCPGLELTTKDNLSFEFFMSKGECLVVFKQPDRASNGKFKAHHMIVYGYEQLAPPSED